MKPSVEIIKAIRSYITNFMSKPLFNHQYQVKNVIWHEDDFGKYFTGDLYRDGVYIGLTGNYYDRTEYAP